MIIIIFTHRFFLGLSHEKMNKQKERNRQKRKRKHSRLKKPGAAAATPVLQTKLLNVPDILCAIAREQRAHTAKTHVLSPEPDDDCIPEEMEFATPWDESSGAKKDVLDMITYGPNLTLNSRIRTLCERFKECFSVDLRPEPARIPPLDLEVDTSA